MNYSHDNWSAILAHIGKPEELDTSARNAGAPTRRREIRDAATLLRLGLALRPWGCHYVKSPYGLSSMTLQHYLTWFPEAAAECRRLVWHTCRTNTCCTRRKVTGCTSGKRLRLVDGTAISAPGAAALNGDYIWDMILIPVSSLILS